MRERLSSLWKFLSVDIWRITENEVNRTTFSLYNIIKTFYITINRFVSDRMINKASALTYSTLLSIVPILAILFAIARGFGFGNILQYQIENGLGGTSKTTQVIFQFVDSYLAHTQGGVFLGVGIVLLLWTFINLVNNMETVFNRIWLVQKERSFYRKISDYFSLLILMPVMIVLSGGLGLFMSTLLKNIDGYIILAPIGKFFIKLIPFIITWMMFTALYVFMPNTKVQFKHAIIPGIIAGTAYQLFQYAYISGQLWVSKYNAIYGSFAALPLFLLWLQMSWTICLFGAEMTYAKQNVNKYDFDKDTRSISKRYKEFISILIMSIICKKFDKGNRPCTAKDLSTECQIPFRLTQQTINELIEINLLNEVVTDKKGEEIAYQPALDIHKLTLALLIERINTFGSEDFKIDKTGQFKRHWLSLVTSYEAFNEKADKILLKDL